MKTWRSCLRLLLVLLPLSLDPAQGRVLQESAAPSPSPSSAARTGAPVFREYIGGGGAALADVPITSSTLPFHFLLAFAVDETQSSPSTPQHPTDGNFSAFWQPRLSPANVRAVKQAHPNVRFSLSVGGGGSVPVFAPTSVASWTRNAVASLGAIVAEYSLDGIDIDYEIFEGSEGDFVACVGEVLRQLKGAGVISMASIAPYPATDGYYSALWQRYNASIDYVNYQMYSGGDMPASQYVSLYEDAKALYPGAVVIPSFETINNGTAIVPSSALDALRTIKDDADLHGIFIWSADQSYRDFQYETKAQALLLT